MPTALSLKAVEQSTYIITASFTDEAGNSVTPDSLKWSLVDRKKRIVNNRKDVEITSLDTSIDIVLSGDDIAIDGDGEVERWIVVEGTYTSDAGSGLPFRDQASFRISNLKSV